MDKQEAIARLDALEGEAKKLREIIEDRPRGDIRRSRHLFGNASLGAWEIDVPVAAND